MESEPILPERIGPYTFHGFIGQGAFSTVYSIRDENTLQKYACKVVKKTQSDIEVEIRINQQLRHPGIVQLIDLCQDENNYYIVLELCELGELGDYAITNKPLKESEVARYMYQILLSLKYIHSLGIVHRDIKAENILLDSNHTPKISDFGLSRFLGNEKLATEICGSPSYASPEVVSHKPYGKETDIWATGVLLYYLVTGDLPWTSRDRMYEQIMSGEYQVPSYVSHSCENLITKLMTVNPKDRITIDEALNHNFFFCMQQSFSADHRVFHLTLKKVDEFFYGKDAPLQYKIKKAFKEWSPSDFCQLAKLLHSDIPAKETEIIKLEMLPRPKSKTRLLPKTTKKVARSPSTTAKLIPTGRPNSAKKSSKLSTKGSPKPVSARLFNESAYKI